MVRAFKIIPVVLIVAMGVFCYRGTLHVPFYLDDEPTITQNPSVTRALDAAAIWKFWPERVIPCFSFALNYHFHGTQVYGYHLVNIAVHTLAALMAWWLCLLILSTPVMRDEEIARHKEWIALGVGLVFVVHPLQTQAVTYIVQRMTIMASFFFLASLCLYTRFRLGEKNSLVFYWGSLAAALAAFFSKEFTVTLPAAVVLLEIFFFGGARHIPWRRVAPFAALLLLLPLSMRWMGSIDFNNLQRAHSVPVVVTRSEYFFTQLRVLMTYLRLLVFPLSQNVDYDYPIYVSMGSPAVLLSAGALSLLGYAALRLFERQRLLSFAIVWFFLTAFPESGMVPINDVAFEHRLYLPMLGYCLFLVAGLYFLWKLKKNILFVIILAALIAWYAFLTQERNKLWADPFALWSDTIAKSPHKARPYNNRGNLLFLRKEYRGALRDFNEAIALDPYHINSYYNRGLIYYFQHDYSRALSDYSMTLRLDPRHYQAFNNRGALYVMMGRYDEAIADYTQALKINPSFEEAAVNLRQAQAVKGLAASPASVPGGK